MRKIFLLFFVMLAIGITVQAQNRTVTGTVTSKDDNGPLIGVTIVIKGSTAATSTDVNGKYSIKVTNLQNVVIGAKYLGYEYQEVSLKPGELKVDFALVATNSSLNEVVVTGYGTTVKGKILGAVSEIKAAEFEDLPVANLGTALRNRVAGVGVSVTSGKPGAATTLALRNPVTFTGSSTIGQTSNPLYVIDGLISTIDDFNNLDASLVETISFLKDASAAIYGASGDKGVVLVTTKKGKIGKTQINYSGYSGTSTAAQAPKMLSAFQQATLLNDGWAASNTANTSRFSQADLDFLSTNPYDSWYQDLWHSSTTQRHTINLSGGTEKILFFAGGSYYYETGNYGNINSTKYNIRSGMTAKLTEDITAYISLNTNYSKSFSNSLKSASSTDTETSQILALITTPQWVPLTINGLPNGYGDVSGNSTWNPIALYNSGTYNKTNAQTINLNSSLEWRPKFVKGLTIKEQFGKNNQTSGSNQWLVPYTVYNFTRTGQNSKLFSTVPLASKPSQINSNSDQLQQGTGYNNSYELITSADYSRVIGKHTFDIMALSDLTEGSSGSNLLYRTTAQIPGVDQFYAYPSSTTTVQLNPGANVGKQSYLGKMSYDYAGKYLMQLITRVDGSTNFPADKRWGAFPDLGLGWRVSEEKWFKPFTKYVNSLKLRLNVGLVGDDRITPYTYVAVNTPASNNYIFGSGNTVVNGIVASTTFANPDVTWEKQRQTNFGIDATFLDSRLTATIEIYNKHTYDGFVDFSSLGIVPQFTGQSLTAVNNGIANNWGSEFDLSFVQPVSKDWTVRANVNFGFSDNNIVQVAYAPGKIGTVDALTGITIGQSSHTYTSSNIGYIATGIIKTQADVDAILAKNPNYTIGGVKPQPGFMNYQDTNGDGKIDANDVGLMYPSVNSPFSGGITLGASYKTFSFSINGLFVIGGKLQTDGQAKKPATTTLNVPVFWADHWTPDNVNAAFPRTDAPLIDQNSTFWTVSATQLRINNMAISWSLPKRISEKLGIPNLRVLASGTNLWTIINPYSYKDPLTSSYSDYPTLRTLSLGLNVTL
ncbi:TonB-linked SusC/RagA family outer membrane protein [Mucilaginibacter gracilis]|uniref:TonB-linked SusC/RagA family outer membrane protein n=1 Tax=Mucilaginibacter gracilis TaxID=423350 RepID=A0A495J6K0_9SPHI|nr:SusC/RagA family TonB-linked outer membrane protein [Mucilaginibacter gracilis]RKR84341.1 TonB-linked SusC/RagA family outer membrane protein [Mucilaginibacter gracilis]